MIGSCSYEHMKTNYVAVDEGNHLAVQYWITLNACKSFCDETDGCNSFAHCPTDDTGDCWLKDKTLDGSEPTRYHGTCTTYYDECDTGT